MSSENSKTCFVISPIGAEGSETRVRSDKILKYVVSDVVTNLGYMEPMRSDKLGEPGIITSQVIKRITEDDLVIADLTELNPNVFYELAIRHMIGKPLVQIMEKGHRLPFDVAAARTVFIDHRDLESVNEAKQEIREQIEAVEEDPAMVDNPITVSLQLEALKNSDVSADRALAAIQERLESIEGAVRNVEGIHELDDVMSKVEDIDHTCDEIKGAVSDLQSSMNA